MCSIHQYFAALVEFLDQLRENAKALEAAAGRTACARSHAQTLPRRLAAVYNPDCGYIMQAVSHI